MVRIEKSVRYCSVLHAVVRANLFHGWVVNLPRLLVVLWRRGRGFSAEAQAGLLVGSRTGILAEEASPGRRAWAQGASRDARSGVHGQLGVDGVCRVQSRVKLEVG
jgi:hypothetical protein